MAKVQIWLRDDERDLVHRALLFVADAAAERIPLNARIDKFAVKLARDRVAEVAELFAPKPSA